MNQKSPRVAALGPAPTFSSQTANQMCIADAITLDTSFESIRDVIKAVDSGGALIGVVPLGNSTASVGRIRDTELALAEFPQVRILFSRVVPIEMSLIAQEGVSLDEIRTIISKSQALEQIRQWLADNVSGAELVNAASTSEGLSRVKGDRTVAVVGLSDLSREPGLTVLRRGIQDAKDNATEFAVVVNPETFTDGGDDGTNDGTNRLD